MNPNIYNPQTNYAQQYQQATQDAVGARNNLSDYSKNIQDYGSLYKQDLGGAEQHYGFNPADLQKAQMALATTNTTIANLPEAINQQGNYYGTTAGAQANNYSQQAGRLAGVLAGQSNTVNAYQAAMKASQDLANAQAGYTVMSEKQKQDALNQVLQAALQGQTNAGAEQANAGTYDIGARNAAAAAQKAAADAALEYSQRDLNRQQSDMTANFMKSPAYQQYLTGKTPLTPAMLTQAGAKMNNPTMGGAGGYSFTVGGKPASVQAFAQNNGMNFVDILKTISDSGDPYAAQAYAALNQNGGIPTPQIVQQFPGIFSTNTPSTPQQPTSPMTRLKIPMMTMSAPSALGMF
jgi:hypothetical protein